MLDRRHHAVSSAAIRFIGAALADYLIFQRLASQR